MVDNAKCWITIEFKMWKFKPFYFWFYFLCITLFQAAIVNSMDQQN